MAVLVVLHMLAAMSWNMWTYPDWAHEAEAEASNTQSVRDRNAGLGWTRLAQEPI
jgi:hypothetical protein